MHAPTLCTLRQHASGGHMVAAGMAVRPGEIGRGYLSAITCASIVPSKALHSRKLNPLVSGANKTHTIKPSSVIAALRSMVGPIPNVCRQYGNENVPMAAPTRVTAVAIPNAVALTSVGNSSFG